MRYYEQSIHDDKRFKRRKKHPFDSTIGWYENVPPLDYELEPIEHLLEKDDFMDVGANKVRMFTIGSE